MITDAIDPFLDSYLQNSEFGKKLDEKATKFSSTLKIPQIKKALRLDKIFRSEEEVGEEYQATRGVRKWLDDHPTVRSWVGEIAGDGLAVPFTVMLQRIAPGFMNWVRKVSEPVLGKFFRKSAERSARKWAIKEGHSFDSEQYKERVEKLYRHEIDHVPQAFVWSVSSVFLNALTQKAVGNTRNFFTIATTKTAGALSTIVLVMGLRGFFPGLANRWDDFTSEKIFLPMSKKAEKALGLKSEPEDSKEQEAPKAQTSKTEQRALVLRSDWKKKVQEPKETSCKSNPNREV